MLTILAESALRSLVLGSVVWVGLNLLRARNPHVHMTSWVMVLVASLSMPFLMHWTTVTVTLDPLPLSAAEKLWPASAPLPEPLPASSALELGPPIAARGEIYQAVNWWAVATAIYALVAGMFLLRLAVGLYLTWRLARAARPISESWVSESWVRESWAGGSNLRVSDAIGAPVTFGSTVLLPPQYIDWDSFKRRAVLAHEGAHIANRDFYILLLASINRAVFWFNPLAWWQLFRMAELAEIISDARALEVLEDRPSYAEILLDFVQNVRQAPAGLEMARPCTVRARVEHILAAPAALPKIGWRERIGTLAAILPVVVVSAGSIAYRATPITVSTIDRAGEVTAAARKPQHVDFYSLGPTSVFAIFREGDDVFAQLTGQRKLPLTAKDDGTYSYSAAAGEITFAVGDDGPRAELMLRRNGRDLRAARIAETPRQQAGEGSEAHASLSDSYVGWYELAPSRVLSVTRDGSRTYVQETGRPKFEVAAQGVDAFASGRDDLLIFLRDAKRDVTQVLLQEPISGARLARRIDAAKARLVDDSGNRPPCQAAGTRSCTASRTCSAAFRTMTG